MKKNRLCVQNAAMNLRLDYCSHQAAEFACKHWHYSKTIPCGKLVKFGVWEDEKFIGAIIYGRGATPQIGSPYGLLQTQICELVKIALTNHKTPVSKMIGISLKLLRKQNSGLKMVVSFADGSQNHHGGIYQASNWIYCGGAETHKYIVLGKEHHPKTLHAKYGIGGQSIPWLRSHVDKNAQRIKSGFKHRYLYPFCELTKNKILKLSKPYPKRGRSVDSDTTGLHPVEGGATPTLPLHLSGQSQKEQP